jgi:transcription antitermination protein NusB
MRVETRARARALQALYAWEMRGSKDLMKIAQEVWDDLAVSPDEREIAVVLVRAVAAHSARLDQDLSDVTTNWRLERIGAIERSVLRLGAAELGSKQTPPRVVIKEAVRLAERFGSEESARFVNGVLDAYARKTGMI